MGRVRNDRLGESDRETGGCMRRLDVKESGAMSALNVS